MKKKLVSACPWPEVFAPENIGTDRRPKNELAYFRADYDGYRWWNTVWPVHKELKTDQLVKEFDSTYNMFIKSFPDLKSIQRFCSSGYAEKVSDTEYNVYLTNRHGMYWFRLILRRGDYNLYLHCYKRI